MIQSTMTTLGYDDKLCTVAQFETAMRKAMLACPLERRPAAPAAPVVPTDKNGRALTPAQIAWGGIDPVQQYRFQ